MTIRTALCMVFAAVGIFGCTSRPSVQSIPPANAQALTNGIAADSPTKWVMANVATAVSGRSCPKDILLCSSPVGDCPEKWVFSTIEGSPVRMMNDVRSMDGFHVIGKVTGPDNEPLMHVADTCQHYLCSMNEECMQKGGSNDACFYPTGCGLAKKE